MNTRETFGKYLLLMKLSEDPLGEAFRAGRGSREGLESVILLRVFNGPSLDTARLGSALAARKEVQSTLKSPNIGSGVEVGQVSGVPYAAYDYISGKNLVTLLAQASSAGSPFPTDHALLIADRLGFALTAAYETRHDGKRVHHGLVVPPLVMISNEGETRLLGFETGPGLAEQAGKLPEEIQRYLAPEARAGAPPSAANDVFSLGAILFELLTGSPLPVLAPQGYGAIVDQARLPAEEDAALPHPLATLLKASLAPADARIADPASWQKALAKVMVDGGYNATTFNLAFYMHNLFRDDIERESQEIEAEKTLAPAGSGLAVGAAGGADTIAISREEVAEAAAAKPDTGEVRTAYGIGEGEGEAASRKGLWIGLAAALLVAVLGGVGYWLYARGGLQGPEQVAEVPAPIPAPVEAEQAPAEPAREELQAQIDAMLEEKTQAMEASLKEEYDQRIAAMQKQLQQAEAAAAERSRRQEEARAAANQVAEPAPAPVQEVRPAPGSARPGGADAGPAAGARAAGPETSADLTPAAAPAPQPPAPAPRPVPAAPAPAPEPQVRVGELVSHGPGVVSPRVTRRGTPSFPQVAARLNKEATVDVQVLVDETGKVLEARVEGRKAGFGFDEASLEAARSSTFEPATKFGVKVRMWTTMRFVFKR